MHSKTPWKLDTSEPFSEWPFINDADGDCVCTGSVIGKEDATLIVRAVNAHDALVDALEGIMSCLNCDDDGDYFICAEAEQRIIAAEQALALAKGE